jgi:hypothetical protein
MNVFNESTLSDSYIYGLFNNDSSMTKRIAEAIKNGLVIDSSYIQEQILQIKRTRLSPLVDNVLKAYEDGTIILIYSKLIKIPRVIPFVVLKMGDKNKVVIFVNNHGTITDSGVVNGGKALTVPMKDLYVLMEGAYLAWSYYNYPVKFQRSIGLMKLTNNIYTTMVINILNKEYGLSMNPDLFNTVSFCVSRFYLERIWELESRDLIFNYALQILPNTANRATLSITNDEYTQANIDSIDKLITFIKNISPRLDTLNTRYFTECYINLYKDVALLSMDTLPYFIFTLVATYCGSFMVNQPKISDIIKNTKGSNIFYNELSKLA